MRATRGSARRRQARHVLLALAAAWLAAGAHAQSASCEQFRDKLAERIEAGGVRGYSIEMVPGRAPLPSGARVIGTCDGGATKIVYWRFGKPRAAAAASATGEAAPPKVASPKVAETPSAQAPEREPAKLPPPAPERTAPPPAPEKAAAPPPPSLASLAASAAAPPIVAPEATPPVVAASAPAAAAPAVPEPAEDRSPPWSDRLAGLVSDHWIWLCAVLAVPFGAWLWAWRSHRLAYDKAGLPRGPRLRP
jgi:hypothetical protein